MQANTTTTVCPPIADLERLVRGRLTEARAAALSEHIGSCSACQQRLEALCGECDELAANLRECTKDTPPSDSAYHRALALAEEEVRATALLLNGSGDAEVEVPTGEPKLDFLQPPDENGHLGKLGSFSILRIVGRGGMGVVLHAYDPCLARDVAVKVIDPQLANNEVARQRFCREARAAAAVTHDNLVAVHQVDEDEASGLPYLVMQLVNGESLEQRLKRVKTLTVPEVARLGMQAAAGLAAAHAGGLIHRDIKPGNILLEAPADRVKLTDFGLARAVEDVKLTRTGFVAGSPLYMAPEQARGEEVDHRADLFSLGSVLYESVTGKPAFDAKTPLAVLRRVADESPKPLHEVSPEVPVWLSDIVDKLLAKNPADRYQNASEVAEEFAGVLAREHALSPLDVPAEVCPSVSRSSTRTRQPICWKGVAFRVVPWLGGAVLGALLGILLWPREVTEKIVEVHVPAPVPDPGPAPKLTLAGNAGTVWSMAFLGGDRLVVGMDDGNVKIWDLKKNTVLKTLEPRLGGTVWSVDVSADGKRLVTTSDDSRVYLWDLDTYKVAKSYPQPTSTKAAVFNSDGTKLATGDRNATIRVWDVRADIPIELHGHHGTVHSLAFSPDGTMLASAGSDGTAKLWNLTGDPPIEPVTLGEHLGPVYGVAFCPKGAKLATTGWDGTVRIWDAIRGSQIQTIKAHEGDAWSVSFGGDGKWVASAGQDGVKVWNVETGKEIFSYRGTRAFHIVRFAKDGTTLAAGGRDGSVKVWEIKQP
jgi:serine/threonine protein kinase